MPRTKAEVRQVIAFAAERELRVAPQGTGHGAGALGLLQGTVLLRTDGMLGTEVDPDARSGGVLGGARWHDVVPLAAAHGLATMHGSVASARACTTRPPQRSR
jgi:FAD/FMN-containing dehydrogenase